MTTKKSFQKNEKMYDTIKRLNKNLKIQYEILSNMAPNNTFDTSTNDHEESTKFISCVQHDDSINSHHCKICNDTMTNIDSDSNSHTNSDNKNHIKNITDDEKNTLMLIKIMNTFDERLKKLE